MDLYIDSCCKDWADCVLGGLPGAVLRCTLDDTVISGSDADWPAVVIATDRAVAGLSEPWKRVIKLQYLSRCLTKYQRAGRLDVSVRKYYAMLGEAHAAIARELAAGELLGSGVA